MKTILAEHEWCCCLFKEAIERRGESGLAIAKGADPSYGLYFALEFRAVGIRDEKLFRNEGSIPFRINMTQAIHFCPWCGKSLRDFYNKIGDRLPSHDKVFDY